MSKLDLDRLKLDLKDALTGELLIRHYCPDEDVQSAQIGSEYKVKCCLPGHMDETPSLFISSDKFVYHCKGQCSSDVSKGDFIRFIEVMDRCDFMTAVTTACNICGLSVASYGGDNSTSKNGTRKPKPRAPRKPRAKKDPNKDRPKLDSNINNPFHSRLLRNLSAVDKFTKRRNLTVEDIIEYKIGLDQYGNYTLPIFDIDGNLVNIKYRHKDEKPLNGIPKYWSYKAGKVKNPQKKNKKDWWMYGDPRLFGADKLSKSGGDAIVLITAGEYDAIQINRLGLAGLVAVASTSGEGTWNDSWTPLLSGRKLYICFDNDAAGRVKSKELSESIAGSKVISIEDHVGDKGDLTDFFTAGNSIDIIFELIKAADAESIGGSGCDISQDEYEKDDILRTLSDNKVISVNPAFTIVDGVVYITSMFERNKTVVLKDGSVEEFKTNEPMIISSNRNIYEIPRLSKDVIKADPMAVATFRGWTVKQEPQTAQTRWAGSDVIRFLKGEKLELDAKKSFNDIYFSMKRYSKFYRKTYRGLVSLYIMGSYFYEGFQSYPYLHLNGEKGSGKSTVGRVIAAMSFNGDFVINPTVAVIARSIQEQKGLIVFDEVEQQSQRAQGRSEMGQIFNSGYQRGAKRPVCDPDNKNKRVNFDLYCPKVICNIFGLNDTTKNRCISIRTQKIKDKSVKIKDPQTDPELRRISKDMYRLMMGKTKEVLVAYEEVKSMSEFEMINYEGSPLVVHGRERELYTPIFTMARFIYNESGFERPWNNLVSEFYSISDEKGQDEADAPEERLRNALKDELIKAEVNELDMNMYELVVAYKGQYVDSPGNAIEHWIGKSLRKLHLCDDEKKVRRKTVSITRLSDKGVQYTEKKKLMVFKITRKRLGIPLVEFENEEIPF